MKKLLTSIVLIYFCGLRLSAQTCPDCNTVTFTTQNATGYGCTGELFVNFNNNCPTQIQVSGTQYNNVPYNNINPNVTPPYGHWNLKAGTYSFQLTSYDGLTQQCSTAFIPFTITQPICDYDLHYQFGTPDYCIGTLPVSIWSSNQGCTNTENGISNKMVINGDTSYNNQPVIIDMNLNDSATFTVYNYDVSAGSLQALCSENISVTAPGCAFGISLTSTMGASCNKHSITAIASGSYCGGFWSADLYLNGLYDTSLYSVTNQIKFLNLSNGNYQVIANTGICSDSKNISLNYCPKPYGTLSAEITASGTKLKWTKQTCALGYQVKYRALGTITWITKSVSANIGNKVLTGLIPSTTYEWKVRTKCQSVPVVYSAFSGIKTFSTLAAREGSELSSTSNTISDLSVSPNPAQNQLFISFDCVDPSADLLIINLTGQAIRSERMSISDNQFSGSINLEDLAPGIYLVMIKTENSFLTKRFVKE